MCLRKEEIQRKKEKEKLAVAAVLSAQCLAWRGWCKMWCVLASAVARLPTRPARGTVNHVNDLDPRDATDARGKTVKYTPSTCGRARRTHGLWRGGEAEDGA